MSIFIDFMEHSDIHSEIPIRIRVWRTFKMWYKKIDGGIPQTPGQTTKQLIIQNGNYSYVNVK